MAVAKASNPFAAMIGKSKGKAGGNALMAKFKAGLINQGGDDTSSNG